MDFNGDDAIFEVGIVAIGCVLILVCCCCGCRAWHGCTYAPKCIRDRQRRRRQEERIKKIRKRKMKEEEDLTIQERRRRKYARRQRNFEKRLIEGHWKTRGFTGSQRRRMLEDRRKREEAKEAKEEMVDTGIESGEHMEPTGSPDLSLQLPRGSVGSTSSGSTLWVMREGSDIYSPHSRMSFHDNKKKETVVNIEEE